MPGWTVLMDWAKQDDGQRCPFGLVLSVNCGNGVLVERCNLKVGHKEWHRAGFTVPSNDGFETDVRIEWSTCPRSEGGG